MERRDCPFQVGVEWKQKYPPKYKLEAEEPRQPFSNVVNGRMHTLLPQSHHVLGDAREETPLVSTPTNTADLQQ